MLPEHSEVSVLVRQVNCCPNKDTRRTRAKLRGVYRRRRWVNQLWLDDGVSGILREEPNYDSAPCGSSIS